MSQIEILKLIEKNDTSIVVIDSKNDWLVK